VASNREMTFGPSPIYMIPSAVIGVVLWAYFFYLLHYSGKLSLIFLVIFAVPITLLVFYINYRVIKVEDNGLVFYSLFGKKKLAFEAINSIRVVKVGMRKVLWVESEKGILIIPFVFSRIANLRDVLKERLGEVIDVEGWERSLSDIILLYFIAILLLLVFSFRSL